MGSFQFLASASFALDADQGLQVCHAPGKSRFFGRHDHCADVFVRARRFLCDALVYRKLHPVCLVAGIT